jgi:hypothetical protein
LLLARRVVDDGWPIVRAAEHFHVSWPTAKRWAIRYAAMGAAGMADRSSRPHHSPSRTAAPVVRRIVELRWRHRLSPLAIASRLSMPASTVHAVLVRCQLNRLSHIDIRTGEVIRRYEHDAPGSLIHVDVKKLGNIPTGGATLATRSRRSAPGGGVTRNRSAVAPGSMKACRSSWLTQFCRRAKYGCSARVPSWMSLAPWLVDFTIPVLGLHVESSLMSFRGGSVAASATINLLVRHQCAPRQVRWFGDLVDSRDCYCQSSFPRISYC